MCMSGLVLYTEIIIRSGQPRHRGDTRGSLATDPTMVADSIGLHKSRSTSYPGPWEVSQSVTDCCQFARIK